jgi:hypothetical protein
MAAPGSVVKVPVSVTGFKQVAGAQFTAQWDPAILRFVRISGLNLAGLSAENFGMAQVEQGKITLVWDDPRTVGVTVPDETAIFTLELQALGQAGRESVLALADAPTKRRVVVGTEFGQFITEYGLIRVEDLEPPVKITVLRQDSPPGIHVVVPTVKGKSYVVEYTEYLTDVSNWRALAEFAGDGAAKVLVDERPIQAQRFYRVRVE